jgi:hypothetical protein
MQTDYSRDWRLAKWGSGLSLHGSNPQDRMSPQRMSAMCHFRTFATLIRKSKLSLNGARQSMYNSLESCQRDVPKFPHRSFSDVNS